MDYLEIAKKTMNFINTRKRKGPEGIFWSLEDAAKGRPIYYDEICMYAGASGILCFLLGLYDATKESAYLEEAEEAGAYLKYRWENEPELKRNFSKYAFSSGWSGAGLCSYQTVSGNRKKDICRYSCFHYFQNAGRCQTW